MFEDDIWEIKGQRIDEVYVNEELNLKVSIDGVMTDIVWIYFVTVIWFNELLKIRYRVVSSRGN